MEHCFNGVNTRGIYASGTWPRNCEQIQKSVSKNLLFQKFFRLSRLSSTVNEKGVFCLFWLGNACYKLSFWAFCIDWRLLFLSNLFIYKLFLESSFLSKCTIQDVFFLFFFWEIRLLAVIYFVIYFPKMLHRSSLTWT